MHIVLTSLREEGAHKKTCFLKHGKQEKILFTVVGTPLLRNLCGMLFLCFLLFVTLFHIFWEADDTTYQWILHYTPPKIHIGSWKWWLPKGISSSKGVIFGFHFSCFDFLCWVIWSEGLCWILCPGGLALHVYYNELFNYRNNSKYQTKNVEDVFVVFVVKVI